MSEPRTHKIAAGRIALNIVEWGDPAAPPLILQHGGRDHARSWDDVARAFAGDYRVIAPDMRGHGDSDWAADASYDLIDFVQDFAMLMDALALPPCPIVGHSLGANIVTRWAGLYPDRVTRLVNIEGLGSTPAQAAKEEARDELETLAALVEMRKERARFEPRVYPELASIAAQMRKADTRLTPALADHLAFHAARPAPGGGFLAKHDPAMKIVGTFDIRQETKYRLWAAIRCPVLLVYGAQSWATNPADDGRAAHFPDARVELFEDAGHWVHHDRQADFIAMVRDFLA